MKNLKKIKLKQPIERITTLIVDGKEETKKEVHNEITLDLDKITGKVLLGGEQRVLSQGLYYNANGINTSIAYQVEIASDICEPKISSQEIFDMKLNDFTAITGAVKGFLDASDYLYQLETMESMEGLIQGNKK
ncbi:MAG: hypothetical protein ACRC0V_12505 [Fusobacteriaceae bacterium]